MSDLSEEDLEMACTVSDRLQTMNYRAFVDREALALADRLQRAAVEIRRRRAMVKRIEAYIATLDNYGPEDGGTYTHLVIAAEFRRCMKGDSNE